VAYSHMEELLNIVAEIAAQWIKVASQERKKLIRQACRTLIKNGHKKTLKVLGFNPPKIKQASIDILTPEVVFAGALQFTIKKIITRVYYPGTHTVEVVINGVSVGAADFQLLMP